MPFSYDINPDESSRTRRRSQRIETENSERIEYKALGRNLGQLARGAVAFDPNAEDGDGDGLVQDNTPYERPAALSNIASTIRRGLASATGSTSLFNNGFSPLQGMTNREVAEYAVPDNPVRFLEMRLEQQALLRLNADNPFIKEDLEKLSFDPEGIEQLRNLVEKTLDDRPALRVAWDRFGVPPIGIASGDNNYAGVFLSDSILIDEDGLKIKPLRSVISNMRIINLMSSAALGSSRIKGIKRTFVSTDATDTLTHEWGHYLQTLTQQIHPDYKIREAATLLDAYWWRDGASYLQNRLDKHPTIKRLYDYFNNLDESYGVINDPPDDSIPFIASSYATTKPGEFVAESISAYFSPNKKTRALLNDAGAQLVEEVFLGIGRSGLASTSSGRRTTTGNSMRGLTPAEMAERIVPSTLEEALLSIGDHQAITAFDNESKDVKPEAMKMVVPNGVDDLDFSPETVKEMREVITKALAENKMFREMAERHGFPPVMATKRGSEWRDGEDTYAVSMIEGFPSIIVNKDVRNTFLALEGTYNETYSDMGMLEGTEGFLVDVSENSIIAHEWGHYINRNAAASHPDPDTRALAAFWFSEGWDYDAGLTGIWKALDKMGINVGNDKVSQRIIGAKRFAEKVKNGKSQKWTGYPHVMSQYGQTIPAEAFAEAVAAMLLDKEGLRNKVSPAMREDVLDILGRPQAYERDIARGIDEGRAGLASFSVPRNQDGDMIIPSRIAGDPDVDKTPLGGRDYLKDATNEEIADTIAVRSEDDFVSMTLMNMLYGQDPSNSSAYISQMIDAIRFSFFPETRGKPGHFIDFTPQGVDRTRKIINNALDASPEFAWIMRTFGSVPIVSIDPDEIDRQRAQELLTGTKIISNEAGSESIMGWSLGMLGIVLNTSSNSGRKRHAIGQRQRSTAQIRNENNQIEEFLMNTDLSMEGTLYHEYFHSFYDRVLGWHGAMKASASGGIILPGERTDRQNYLYPGVAGVDKLTRLLKDSFDEEGFIPYSTLKPSFVDPIIKKATRKIMRNNDNDEDFIEIMANHDGQLGGDGRLWTPELSRRTLEKIRARYPYLVDDLAPLIAVHYGTASRQEHFAEGGVLFVTPDKRQRSNYLSPELEAIYAYILGLKSDPSPGDYNKPWLERSGLASRSQSSQRSINTLNERVHTGKELFVQSGGAEKRPDVIGRSDNMTDVSINGYKFSISGKLPELQEAYDGWNDWQENWRMRYISSEIMGLDGLPSQTDTRMWQSIANNHLKNGTLNEASYDTRNDIQRSTVLSLSLMREIASSERPTDAPLYRSISNVGENDSIARLRIGETLSMPLTSFSPDYNSVVGFSKDNDQLSISDAIRPTGNVIVKLNPGAKVVDSPVRKQTPTDDGREINMPIESITAGEFVVKSKTNVNGVDVIELEQSRVIDPIPGLASGSLSGDIVNDYALVKRTQMNREKIDSIPEVHEHSKWLTSLRTPKERKERIMALLESLAIRDFSTQSVDEAIDDIARDIERMAQSGLFNQGEGELRPDDAQNYWYIQSAVERASQVLKRAIYRDVVDDEESDRLANRVDEWEMDFRVTDPSGGPSNMFEEFGLASASRNPLSGIKGEYVQSVDEDITSRGEYISKLEKALKEWNDTGVWKGGDYGVVVNPDVQPSNITREEMLEKGYNPDNFSKAVEQRLGKLRNEVSGLEKSRERIEKQPETTTQIEAILGDEETLARITDRAKEISAMPRAERADFFQDGEYRYVVHWGADVLDGGTLDPSRSRGDESSQAVAGNTRRINKVTAMQLVAVRDDQKQKLEDLTNIQKEFEETGLVNFGSAKNPMGVERMIGYLISRGKNRNAQYHGDKAYRPFPDEDDLKELGIDELTPEMKEEIALIIERSRNGAELRLQSLDTVADKLIADDYQYSSTYPAEDLETANGYGGRYGEEGDSWGNDRPLANRAGIHVFRVRMGQDATTETGGPGEIHIIGQHTPIASLSIETHRNSGPQPTSAQYTWQGWLAEVVEADKKSRAGLASSSMQLTPTDDIEEAKRTGRPLSILRPGTMPPETQSAYDEINDIMDRSLQEALELRKRYQDVWDRNPTPPYSDEEKDAIQAKNKIRNELLQPALNASFANLNRALIEEYKSLGFNEEDLYIVKQGILNHLNEKRSYLYGIYGQPELWSDEARLQHSVEALDEADIAIAFPKDLLEQLIQDGRFKTQFETKSSRGSLHPEGRKQTDVAQFGYHPDTAPEMRPVFGYLTKGGVIDKSTLGSIKQYGELQFILKRDTHSRSTYTTHDSLSTGLTPSPMGVPSKDASGKVGETMYAEAQIHGGLTLGDVDYVVINVGEPDQWDWQNNKVAQEEFESISGMLATIGIRVVPVRDGEVVDTWNGGKTTPEQPVEVVAQSQEPVKVVA